MKQFKGTPAPWDYNGERTGFVGNVNGDIVASVYPMYEFNSKEMKANAHLIAAAPELLEVLIEMQRNGQKQGWNDKYESSMEKTNLAIAKALGETK